MKKKDSMIISTAYQDIINDISIVYYDDGLEYWCLNDLNKFVPQRRLDNWLVNEDTKNYVDILEHTIIPGKSGIITKRGKGGGTYAHRLIALKFAAWLDKAFELHIYMVYDQSRKTHETWSKERALTKYEYRLMTDAIKDHIAIKLVKDRQGYAYANEAIILNEIVFGQHIKGVNPRESATIEQLLMLKTLERYNATFIEMEMSENERRVKLKEMYDRKLTALLS